MKHSPFWKADSSSAGQEIPCILQNQKVHRYIHNGTPLFLILSHINPVHTPSPSYYLIFHFNITLQSMPRSLKLHLSLSLPTKTLYGPLPCACHMSHTSLSSWFDHQHNIWWAAQIMKSLISHSPPVTCYLIPLRPKYLPQHPIFEHLQSVSLPQCERPSFTPI